MEKSTNKKNYNPISNYNTYSINIKKIEVEL